MDLTQLYKKQISFTEWFEKIGHETSEEMRKEDNEKRERLKMLSEIIGLPFDKPRQFKAIDLVEKPATFITFLEEHGDELCALRLIPLDPRLPKLRMRGHSIKEVMDWFVKQEIDPRQYKADFVPHAEENEWATIFIVNKNGIFGEIIKGGHHQLTQGFYNDHKPITFSYNFTAWKLSPGNEAAKDHLKEVMSKLFVSDHSHQSNIKDHMSATFINNYLTGYFETVASREFGLWFIDYNRILGEMFEDYTIKNNTLKNDEDLTGNSAFGGRVRGKVRVINANNLANAIFYENEILVCNMTTPDFVPLMQKAVAIITDKGGILSHAAIVSRELQVPCITGTEKATSLLKDGDEVEVDADNGVVRVL